ncbi:MAG: Gfo/Idh/MocA family oxidoreductase [Candidatus Hinthialibacter antarcticus]|nr:Gfo/Idh/MocA family oxidoreductase [Candidatus Hinthialibacter antarcticus]
MKRFLLLGISVLLLSQAVHAAENTANEIRLGMIGLDTSHVIAFTKMLNDPTHADHVPGARVIAAVKGGSPDVKASAERVDGYTQQLKDDWDMKIVETIAELCGMVDGVLIESIDGRPHLQQAKQVIDAGLPLFIDKPVAGSFADVVEIARYAKAHGVPWFGGSSLRWWKGMRDATDPEIVGEVLGCDAYSPCSLEEHHPDLFWYGVHGVSILYAAMGTGCQQVSRASTEDTDVVVGVWPDGRIGTFRGIRNGKSGYGATVFGSQKIIAFEGHSYKGLIEAIVGFFKSGNPPLSADEIVEMYAFMEAADISKAQGGAPVALPKYSLE